MVFQMCHTSGRAPILPGPIAIYDSSLLTFVPRDDPAVSDGYVDQTPMIFNALN